MGIVNNYKWRKLERKIKRWKEEGNRLQILLIKTNTESKIISNYCITALNEFHIDKPKEAGE